MDAAESSAPASQPAVEISEEDRARADCYALISRLFYGPPDVDLLKALAGEPEAAPAGLALEPAGGLELERIEEDVTPAGYAGAYAALREICAGADLRSVHEEYDELFISAGKALITPYTSGYAYPNAPDRHLVALREQLVGWGLARRDSVFEVEDHVSAICDVMRWLIEHDRPLAVQRAFFDEFVYAGVGTFCDAINANPGTSFYRAVAGLARAFLGVEREAFDMDVEE